MDEAGFRKLISGETTGFIPALQRAGLRLLSIPYRIVVGMRNWLFNVGVKRCHRVDATVVSVGNVTTGGTGKTPFVAWLTQHFQSQYKTVALLSRGYGAEAGQPNDEKQVLEQLCPGVPHLQDPNRVAIARQAIADYDAQVLILDDGFQHRRLARNFDVVLIDALNPFGYGHVLPRGLLREPMASLQRANAIVITRVDTVDASQLEELTKEIQQHNSNVPIAHVAYRPSRLINSDGSTTFLSTLSDNPIAAFCGIGHPEAFEKNLHELGFNLVWLQPFPDHHNYTSDDIQQLAERAAADGIYAILTTQKDLVKINQAALNDIPLWAVQIETHFLAGEAEFVQALESQLAND